MAKAIRVRVTATEADCREASVFVVVSGEPAAAAVGDGEGATLCQSEPLEDGQVRLTFLVRDLKRGDSREYLLSTASPKAVNTVDIKRAEANAEIHIDGRLAARYDATTGPNKPYLYPVFAPGGKQVVRHWPVDPVPGETTDHPHHRGIWFTHGDLNGIDFWLEGPGTGRTVHQEYLTLSGGPVYGLLRARTRWLDTAGGAIAEDTREIWAYRLKAGYALDFDINIKPIEGSLTWGDTKEGTFALRVADAMTVRSGGSLLNSAENRDASAWGKAASWCAYWGKVEGESVGFIVCDHPQNLRHPTPWGARDYGLLSANPFGLHDFYPAHRDERHAGRHVTEAGDEQRFRYRVLIHQGASPDLVPDQIFRDYAETPRAEVLSAP